MYILCFCYFNVSWITEIKTDSINLENNTELSNQCFISVCKLMYTQHIFKIVDYKIVNKFECN